MDSLPPIQTVHLFRELENNLLATLLRLGHEDWHRPTICSRWTIKDIASHLLDGSLRRLSSFRDNYSSPDAPTEFPSYECLVDYLNQLNDDWTKATRRLSPRVLIQLLTITGETVIGMFELTDLFSDAPFPVSWAGDTRSPMWFDIAREYTERWHHQRQIVDALERPTPIDSPHLYHPVLETFLRALPFTFGSIDAPNGTLVKVTIDGPAGGDWFLERDAGAWRLLPTANGSPSATVVIGQDDAWKLFTKRMDRQAALQRFSSIRIHGNQDLGGRVLEMVSIMA